MSTRHRSRPPSESEYDPLVGDVTDEDVELYLAEQAEEEAERSQKKPGFFNLQTGSGLALIGIGIVYLLQQLGFFPLGFALEGLVTLLPWLAGVLIILTGFGVLSWSPSRRRKKAREEARRRRQAQARGRTMGRGGHDAERARKLAGEAFREAGAAGARAFEQARTAFETSAASSTSRRSGTRAKRLVKSRKQRKIMGVCAGIANYLGLEPLIVRIAFVVATVFGLGWASIPLYLVLAFVMPPADPDEEDPRDPYVRVIRP